jgi:putative endonuclease
MNYQIYLLTHSCNNCTYIGITNNLQRRLRQHNNEIVGGARYTKMKKGSGSWNIYGTISNLDKSTALSLERKLHNISKKAKGKTPLEKRLSSIEMILHDTDLKFYREKVNETTTKIPETYIDS